MAVNFPNYKRHESTHLISSKNSKQGNSLAVQWLGLFVLTAKGLSSIPGWGTKIPQTMWHSQKKKVLSRINTKGSTSGHVIIKMSKDKNKVNILKVAREKQLDMYKGELFQMLKEELTPILLKLFQKIEEDRILPNSFYKVSITLIISQTKTL